MCSVASYKLSWQPSQVDMEKDESDAQQCSLVEGESQRQLANYDVLRSWHTICSVNSLHDFKTSWSQCKHTGCRESSRSEKNDDYLFAPLSKCSQVKSLMWRDLRHVKPIDGAVPLNSEVLVKFHWVPLKILNCLLELTVAFSWFIFSSNMIQY